MAYLWVLTGDPLYFSHVQAHWGRHLAAPWVSFGHAIHMITGGYAAQTIANQLLELTFTLLMLGVLASASGACACRTSPTWRSRFSCRSRRRA